MADLNLSLGKSLDLAKARKRFRSKGRVHIPGILDSAAAERLYNLLMRWDTWNLVTDNNGKHLDLDTGGFDNLSADDKAQFFEAIYNQARERFQYLFKNVPIYDRYHSGVKDQLSQALELLNSEPMLDLARSVTGADDIGFADAQATCYEAGHFLTFHDDNVDGKDRRAAFVLNLTAVWKPDWGGALNFLGADGHIAEAFLPTFNALNMFKVPQQHAVGVVAPFAGGPRLAITGWFRTGDDPMKNTAKS